MVRMTRMRMLWIGCWCNDCGGNLWWFVFLIAFLAKATTTKLPFFSLDYTERKETQYLSLLSLSSSDSRLSSSASSCVSTSSKSSLDSSPPLPCWSPAIVDVVDVDDVDEDDGAMYFSSHGSRTPTPIVDAVVVDVTVNRLPKIQRGWTELNWNNSD